MSERFILVVEVDANGGNLHHVITQAQYAEWRGRDDGAADQERGGHSDDRDAEGYSSATDPEDFLLPFVRDKGEEFDSWMEAVMHIASFNGDIVDVIAVVDTDD